MIIPHDKCIRVGLALVLFTWHSLSAAPPEKAQFTLQAEAVDLLEGGPVALKMTLKYQGNKTRHINYLDYPSPFVQIKAPAPWVGSPLFSGYSWVSVGGDPFSPLSIEPGQSWTYIHYLHREYSHIPAGKVTLLLNVRVDHPLDPAARDRLPKLLEEISQPLTLTIPPATPDRLQQLIAKMQAELKKNVPRTDEEKLHLHNTLLDTSHKEFLPTGLALLASAEHRVSDDLLDWMYDLSGRSNSLTTTLTEAILTENPAVLWHVFYYWQLLRYRASEEYVSRLLDDLVADLPQCARDFVLPPHRYGGAFHRNGIFSARNRQSWSECLHARLFRIPDQDWQKLTQSRDLWIRALTCATFPERCDKDWRTRLLADLSRLAQPLPPEEFQPLLQQLEHRQFAVRQRATQQLIQFGDRVTASLRVTLGQRPSLEVRHRVIRILEAHELQAEHPPHRRLLPLLVGLDNQADLAMLQALASGDDNIQLTKDARKLLKEKQAERRRP